MNSTTMQNNQKTYCIKSSYRPRDRYKYFDDSNMKDEWQLEVYLHAQQMMKDNQFNSVIDIGCGFAYKLIKYLGQYETLGTEVSPMYEWLVEKYPDRRWLKSDFNTPQNLSADLLICADVIEHLEDPDELLAFINRIDCKYIILSTPSRDLLYHFWNRGYWGPPKNVHHIREWSAGEFRQYVSQTLEVVLHAITNKKQTTQMVVCRKKFLQSF